MKNVKEINQYIANLALWNVKLHNLHFNVIGSQFKAIHEFLEAIYDEAFGYYDEVAEHLKMMGEMPLVSLKNYLAVATMEELPAKEYTCRESFELLLADLKLMKSEAVAIREVADEEGDFILVGMMEDQVAYYTKQIWFVESTLKGSCHK